LNTRFADVRPEDFLNGGVLFFSAQHLEAPLGFANVWSTINRHHRIETSPSAEEAQRLSDANAVVLMADASDEEQMRRVINMAGFINQNLTENAPPLILMLHTVQPELRKHVDEEIIVTSVMRAIDCGVDEAITQESAGIRLAWEMQNRVVMQAHLSQKFADVQENSEAALLTNRKRELMNTMHSIVWEYFRIRIASNLPPCVTDMPPGVPSHVATHRVGRVLGRGAFGSVHALLQHDGEPGDLVLKMVPKRATARLSEVVNLKQQVEVMHRLRAHPHPNIANLRDVFHSRSHIFFSIENGGPVNLYRFLRGSKLTSCERAQEIISQLRSAVCHLHVNAKVVHRDLKPENILLQVIDDTISIKISDLDTALANPDKRTRGVVGSFPFWAPEILFEEVYNPYAADMWSMGVLVLEVLCSLEVMERAFQQKGDINLAQTTDRSAKYAHMKKVTGRIRNFFSQPAVLVSFLDNYMQPELQKVVTPSMMSYLQGVLDVMPEKRMRAEQV
jgi:hypothetical protein